VTKHPHVLISISTIAIMILPILFILGIFSSTLIYPILTIYADDCSLFFTISGIITLIALLLPPPPNKRKRSIFLFTIKSIWKKFAKPKLTDEIEFDNDMVHFATVKESTKATPLDDEIVNEGLAITGSSSFNDDQQAQNYESICSIPRRKNAKMRLLFSKINAPFKQIHSIFSKFSIFKKNFLALVFTLFLMGTTSIEMDWSSNRFGGATFESRIKPTNQLQLQLKNEFKR